MATTLPLHLTETIVVDATQVLKDDQENNAGNQKRRRNLRKCGDTASVSSSDDLSSFSDSNSSRSSINKNSNGSPSPQRRSNRRKRNTKRSKKAGRNGTSNNGHPEQMPELSDDEKARYIALDCEMVGVGYGGYKSALARVTMIDWYGETVYDQYVLPQEEVTDYRTFVSGITADQLMQEGISFDECRTEVSTLLRNKILVGHALKNDLTVLQICHPWYLTRDTGKYEPFMKVRNPEDGILWPRKLKELAKCKLGRDIQQPGQPHSPIEDAQAALDLYKRAYVKWEKAMAYKLAKTQSIQKQQQKARQMAQ